MTRSTTYSDINVWLAVVVERHVLNRPASAWWNQDQSDAIGFCRFTQLGLLRHAAGVDGAAVESFLFRRALPVFVLDMLI
jgi:predicted nucleic acid-binding protein